MFNHRLSFFQTGLVFSTAILLSACGGGEGSNEPAQPLSGQQLFNQADVNGNQFACSTCHATQENNQQLDSNQLHRPAHPLFNAVKRNAFYNGNFSELIDAVNNCRVDWMDTSSYREDSEQWTALQQYLESLTDSTTAEEIVFNQVPAITDFSGANAAHGEQLFNQTCATCHGENAVGSNLAKNLNGSGLSAAQVASKVRSSGPSASEYFSNLVEGNMPFWSEQRLANQDLADIASYVESINASQTFSCNAANHPKVGQVAMLSTLSHGVSGRVEIVDNCTLEVTGFTYDGEGPDVVFYGAPTSNYELGGFDIGSTINGPSYVNDSLSLSLSNAGQLDSLGGISVWCKDFSVSFGDGLFN
ncbi:DM13 domain-containing protein [Agarivorans sp. TSD2052]|uniref:DM13 domain-containing protein n=1 Tax=Agarivorans sp. TSD2052 TaxID=2937286 RepID=UPI0020108825|nr:DM13 domain-containing protein [Agarivorans sp. TSD2052]UPW16937.1 DM13 domain-containing protein [Agarivorans sp. TSD2052]